MKREFLTSIIDNRGRLTIPIEFRNKVSNLQEGTVVKWNLDNGRLVLWTDDKSVMSLTSEFLYHKILDIEKRQEQSENSVNTIRDNFFRELMKSYPQPAVKTENE